MRRLNAIRTMTKSYLSGRRCCEFTIAEEGCPWRFVDEFGKAVYRSRGGSVPWILDRVAEFEEDLANSPIRRVPADDAPGGPYQMDAVDDIPAELKDKIARAVDEEITRQAAHSLRMARWDYFKVFRAGLTPCRERLNQLRADTTKEG